MHLLSRTQFERTQFEQLSQSASDYSLSIYLPTHVAGPEIRQDSIRLKNLLGEAESQLLNAGMLKQAVGPMLEPAYDLLEDEDFWRHQHQGLALFLTPDAMQLYRLPLEFEEFVTVSHRFHLKPLLPLFFENRYFYILALSQGLVQLFQATRYSISEVPLENVPTSLKEALRYDDPEEQLQFHNVSGDGSVPIYHGHGVGSSSDNNDDIRRFLLKVHEGLHPYLKQEQAPLVLASVEYLQPIYQAINTYPYLLEEGINGNPDGADPEDLRQQAWPLVATLIESSHQDAVTQFHNMQGTDKASDQFEPLVAAAFRGQVDVLFAAADSHCWGQYDPASGQVEQHDQAQPNDQDLLDAAAIQTFLQGGTVYVLDEEAMPTQAPAAAVYRYGVPAEV